MRTEICSRVVVALLLTVAAVVMTVSVAAAKPTAEQQCQKGRHDAAAKYAQCEYKTMSSFFAGGDPGKMATALSNCRVKYTATYPKLRNKAAGTGSTCDTDRFVANADGTVTDNLTDLTWEKKTNDATIHGRDNTGNWLTASDDFLSGTASPRGLNEFQPDFSVCFAFPCNWRLPTRAELQTILSEPFPCTTSPCIDPIFGPTAANYYWTSTEDAVDPSFAWVVNFGSGQVGNALKTDNVWSYRAVRGGL